jgi:hypothetical protein
VDSIARDHVPPDNKPEAVKPYQRLVGGLNWLAISTRPDLSVSVSLLSQFMQDPSKGHLDAGKCVFAWLSGTGNHGLHFTQNLVAWVDKPKPTSLTKSYADANWGPQDASHPREDIVELTDQSSVRSLLGHVVIDMAGSIGWGYQREPKTSKSSCEAEIYCMEEGCKTSETLYHLMTDLSLPKIAQPMPLFNDNRGAVDWSSGCTVSKKLRHLNIRKVAVRDAQKASIVNIHHVPGHSNIADIFTKEHKSDAIFYELAFQLIRPRDLLMKKCMDSGITQDPGGCWKESGIPEFHIPATAA